MSDSSELGTKAFPVEHFIPFPDIPANNDGAFTIAELQKQLDGSELYDRIEKQNHTEPKE